MLSIWHGHADPWPIHISTADFCGPSLRVLRLDSRVRMKPPSQVSLSSSRTTDKVELFQIALVDLRETGEWMNGNPAVVSVETGDGSIHLPRTSIA